MFLGLVVLGNKRKAGHEVVERHNLGTDYLSLSLVKHLDKANVGYPSYFDSDLWTNSADVYTSVDKDPAGYPMSSSHACDSCLYSGVEYLNYSFLWRTLTSRST